VQVSLGLPTDKVALGAAFVSASGVAECSQTAERAGFDAMFVTDHPFPAQTWLERGGHHALDPFVALSFVAANTSALKLHFNLLVMPYRNPFVTAAALASLDALSGGRVCVGVGTGYLEAEFAALGADFESRVDYTDRAVEALAAAFAPGPVHFDGPGYRADGNVLAPVTVQRPHPPLWIGGNSKRAIRRAVEHAQGWSPMPSSKKASGLLSTPGLETVADLAERIELARQLAAEVGRTAPLDVIYVPRTMAAFGGKVGQWSADAVLAEANELAEAGVTWLALNLPAASRHGWQEEVDRFAEAVLPGIHSF
jgi:probable F420-dependent oxidoreductase